MSTLPRQLKDACSNAVVAVNNDPERDLQLGYELAIWANLGPPPGPRTSGLITSKRWIYLQTLAVRQVLPCWDAAFPSSKYPHELLSHVDAFFLDQFNLPAAKEIVYRDRDRFLARGDLSFAEWLVLWASMSVLEATLVAVTRPESFYPYQIDYDIKNQTLDYCDWDATYAASVVMGKGVAWDPISDVAARHQFWLWWIESVSISYCSFE